MRNWDKHGRDAFSFSLGGLTTVASFAAAPAVDANHLNRARDAARNRADGGRGRPWRLFSVPHRPLLRRNRARAA